VCGERQQPTPHQLGGLESAVSSLSAAGGEVQTPQGFSTISALRITSPDTITLSTVDCHAAIGDKTPVLPLPYPLYVCRFACVFVQSSVKWMS